MTRPRMRLGIYLPVFSTEDPGSWDHLLNRARAADVAGVDRVVVADHVVLGENLEAYARPELGGAEGGRQPTGPDGLWLEPLTVLSVVCGITTRVRLTTSVLQAALRRPVVLAKAAATLDVLSGGRLDLGVGVGWQREEYEAAGLDFRRRGQLLDHTLEVLQTLWQNCPASYSSPELCFEGIHCMPSPVQPGGVPIWVSGTLNEKVISRIIRHATGWIPWGEAVSNPSPAIRYLKQRMTDAGRDDMELRVLNSVPVVRSASGDVDVARTMENASRMADAGVTDIRISLPVPDAIDAATDYLGAAVSEFRRACGDSD
jgi:probable F420-dependent oxidoreductase